jgi:hypothetical protein
MHRFIFPLLIIIHKNSHLLPLSVLKQVVKNKTDPVNLVGAGTNLRGTQTAPEQASWLNESTINNLCMISGNGFATHDFVTSSGYSCFAKTLIRTSISAEPYKENACSSNGALVKFFRSGRSK